jgi:hypothetical protein
MDFENFNCKTDGNPRLISLVLRVPVNDLDSVEHEICEIDKIIEDFFKTSSNISILLTAYCVEYYNSIAKALEIGGISRFSSEQHNLLRRHGSRDTPAGKRVEWRGHIAENNTFMK